MDVCYRLPSQLHPIFLGQLLFLIGIDRRKGCPRFPEAQRPQARVTAHDVGKIGRTGARNPGDDDRLLYFDLGNFGMIAEQLFQTAALDNQVGALCGQQLLARFREPTPTIALEQKSLEILKKILIPMNRHIRCVLGELQDSLQ